MLGMLAPLFSLTSMLTSRPSRLAFAQHFAELLFGFSAGRLAHQRIQHAFFGLCFSFRYHLALFVRLGLKWQLRQGPG